MTSRRLALFCCFLVPVCSACRETPPPEKPGTSRILAAPPLTGRPTADSVTVRIVNGGVPATARLDLAGHDALDADLDANEVHDFVVDGLEPGQESAYELVARRGELTESFSGRLLTRREPGKPFTFAVFSDPHLPVPVLEWINAEGEEAVHQLINFHRFRNDLSAVFLRTMAAIRAAHPDFFVCLGDMLHLSDEEFNPPFPIPELAEAAYLDFRRHLGATGAQSGFFAVIGNWDGENGWHPEPLRAHARAARMKYLLNPTPSTYPQGGGEHQDYYAWTWGDALFVALNVMGYTTTVHTLSEDDDGTATSWTLGEKQWAWLEATLAASDERVKMVLAHHPVGGNGGDELNSAYGRGGGRAARVGEQARLHELMIEHGVQVFLYGHDHVFTSQEVDDVHYVLPGSAGAPWKFPTEETGYEDYDPRSGYGLVHVTPQQVRIEFVDLEGEVFRTLGIDVGEGG